MSGQNRNTATEDGEAGDGEVSGEYTLLYIKGGVGMWRAFPMATLISALKQHKYGKEIDIPTKTRQLFLYYIGGD